MVSFVFVSHSAKFAEGLKDLAKMSAPNVQIFTAGGADDGGYGTSYQKIEDAIKAAICPDGVIVIADMGSSKMTVKLVLEDLEESSVRFLDCPTLEGAITSTLLSEAGSDIDEIERELSDL